MPERWNSNLSRANPEQYVDWMKGYLHDVTMAQETEEIIAGYSLLLSELQKNDDNPNEIDLALFKKWLLGMFHEIVFEEPILRASTFIATQWSHKIMRPPEIIAIVERFGLRTGLKNGELVAYKDIKRIMGKSVQTGDVGMALHHLKMRWKHDSSNTFFESSH